MEISVFTNHPNNHYDIYLEFRADGLLFMDIMYLKESFSALQSRKIYGFTN